LRCVGQEAVVLRSNPTTISCDAFHRIASVVLIINARVIQRPAEMWLQRARLRHLDNDVQNTCASRAPTRPSRHMIYDGNEFCHSVLSLPHDKTQSGFGWSPHSRQPLNRVRFFAQGPDSVSVLKIGVPIGDTSGVSSRQLLQLPERRGFA